MFRLMILALLAAIPLPGAAQHFEMFQAICGPRKGIVENLATKFKEEIRVQALEERGFIFEVFVNEETRTWTGSVTKPDGTMCLIVGGFAVEFVRERLNAPDF